MPAGRINSKIKRAPKFSKKWAGMVVAAGTGTKKIAEDFVCSCKISNISSAIKNKKGPQ